MSPDNVSIHPPTKQTMKRVLLLNYQQPRKVLNPKSEQSMDDYTKKTQAIYQEVESFGGRLFDRLALEIRRIISSPCHSQTWSQMPRQVNSVLLQLSRSPLDREGRVREDAQK